MPLSHRILEERTRRLAARRAEAPARPPLRILACAQGEEVYGVPILAAARILPERSFAAIPGAPPAVLGLLARAGRVYHVIDLAQALGLPPAPPAAEAGGPSAAGHVLLLREGPRRYALRVGRVLGVADVQPLDRPGPDGRAVTGHAPLPAGLLPGRDAMVALLDMARLLQPFLTPSAAPGA